MSPQDDPGAKPPTQDDPVQPTPFDAPATTRPPAQEGPASSARTAPGTPAWVWPALGVLVLLAVAVIVWLPASLERAEPEPPAAAVATPDSPAASAANTKGKTTQDSTPGDAAPWSDAQSARERREAQEAAAELLELQYALEELGVETWGAEAFEAAKTSAAQGDELYRNREYAAARENYQQAFTALKTLEASIPEELERHLSAAREGLQDGDLEKVQEALSIATLLSPDNADVAALSARAEKLPELLSLLEQATSAEAAGDLASARSALEQATALDPAHTRAGEELTRVTGMQQAQAFNAAMSDGYAALDEGRFDDARDAFRRASTLREGSVEAASALQEVAAVQSASSLAALEQRGRAFERGEQWQQAVTTYEQAQKVDSSVLFAREGLERSRPRADLDKQLQTIIDEPGRLADVSVARSTEQLLDRARQVTPAGTRLSGQVQTLQSLLQAANSPVTVTLRSDSETEVTVHKVARLGRFAQRELSLRPGTYTAVGSRDGYRDVRQSFTLVHDSVPAPVTIICTEPI